MYRQDQPGSKLHTIRTGPRGASPVLLIHPLGLDLTFWDQQIAALCDEFDVIAFDLPGNGASAGHAQDWEFEKVVESIAQVVREAEAHAVHVVGISIGSMIAQGFALKYSRIVRSLTLIGSAATFSPEARQYLNGMAELVMTGGMESIIASSMPYWFSAATRSRRPDLLDRTAKTLLRNSPAMHAAMWKMVARFDLEAELLRVACPTLIVVGAEDVSTPPELSAELAKLITDSELHVLPGGAHMLPAENPSAVNETLVRFLRQRA